MCGKNNFIYVISMEVPFSGPESHAVAYDLWENYYWPMQGLRFEKWFKFIKYTSDTNVAWYLYITLASKGIWKHSYGIPML
jgi:hypothetical protein